MHESQRNSRIEAISFNIFYVLTWEDLAKIIILKSGNLPTTTASYDERAVIIAYFLLTTLHYL